MDFQTAYSNKTKPVLTCTDESRTKQSFKDDCDITKIIKKYDKTGILTHINQTEAQYGDLVGADFQTAQDIVAHAKTAFAMLPSEVRKQFHNDPAMFLDFADNPDNAETMLEMGICTEKELDQMHPGWNPPPPEEPPVTAETSSEKSDPVD